VLFAVLAWLYSTPWQYAIYGILTGLILAYALRPNIRRLLNGTERVVGYRARGKKKDQQSPSKSDSAHSSS
jgi:glycerol-3-phosphate acyltransferase PlsY